MQYIRFTFTNTEPLKISDDSNSQNGQVNVLSYIPGSALRGAIINIFVKKGEFDAYKTLLLSDKTAFMNAYIMTDGKELIPSLKGFYEDKTDSVNGIKQIENILPNGEFTPGYKRAALGSYCYLEDNIIYYTGVKMGSDMKINKGKHNDKRTVFRNQYIVPGYQFTAYIAAPDDKTTDKLKNIVLEMKEHNELTLGGSRSFGYGKCIIQDVEVTDALPYSDCAVHAAAQNEVYMALLSNMTMVNEYGEIVGIDLEHLKDMFGLSELEIENCATSVVDVRGYNRTWGTWTPAVKMYEMGSVFKLKFKDQEISADRLHNIMNEGLGIRTNEGFGRVLFLDKFDQVNKKSEITTSDKVTIKTEEKLDPDEEETLQIAAKGYYRNLINRAIDAYLADKNNGFGKFNLNDSQLGTIESILYANLYNAGEGFKKLNEYFATAIKKEDDQKTQQSRQKHREIANYIDNIHKQSLPDLLNLPREIMGIKYEDLFFGENKDEEDRIKQELIISQIKLVNRGGINHE